MNKKTILFAFVLLSFVLALNFVSAALCRGDSGYYYCKTDSYSYNYNQYKTDSFKQVIEHKETTESRDSDYFGSERIKITINEKTEIERTKNKPYYPFYMQGAYLYTKAPASSWRFKEPYNPEDYQGGSYNQFYYSQRYDFSGGYYNWRW